MLSAALAVVAHAAWPPDPLSNVPMCTTAWSSQVTAAVPDGRGGAIVVWYEDRNGDFDVFARRVNSVGTMLWSTDGVKVCQAPAGTSQLLPKAVSDGAGGIIVAWVDDRTGSNTLWAQRVDSLGTCLWATAGVLVAQNNTALVTSFSMVADGAGGAVITWATLVSGLSSDIYSQRLNASGAAQWGVRGASTCLDAFDQYRPQVIRRGSGTFVVVWEDVRRTFRTDLYGQSYTTTGTAQWTRDGLALVTSADNAFNPMPVATATGDFHVFWDADSLGVGQVRGQRYNTNGAPLWAPFGLEMFMPGYTGLAAVASDDSSGAYLVMNCPDTVSNTLTVRAQRVRPDGLRLFTARGKRLCAAASNQLQAVAATDGVGGLLVAWFDDQRQIGVITDVFAQRVSRLGVMQWAKGGLPVSRAPNAGAGLAIAPALTNGAILAWSDTRTSPSPDVYVQGVDEQGRLGSGLGVEPPVAPVAIALAPPSPNPVPAGRVRLAFTLSQAEDVTLNVVDPSGRMVSRLDRGVRGPGTHVVTWDGRVEGRRVPPGIYLVQLVTASHRETRRLVLL